MRVLITGANGFLGKNLQLHLRERTDVHVLSYTRADNPSRFSELLRGVDTVFHLAGVNRPENPVEFMEGNADLTCQLMDAVVRETKESGKQIKVVFASSTQAGLDNPYGQSKRVAEQTIFEMAEQYGLPSYVCRLPNVFGKWCRPYYNSVVATFCHNITRDLPIQIHDPEASLMLVYVDDVISRFLQIMDGQVTTPMRGIFCEVSPQYLTTVGALAEQLHGFRESRNALTIDRVGQGLVRALYATYVSYLPVEAFAYQIPQHRDARGVFVEMLKTEDSGQFSFFTANPGVTRGGHYHHSKTEKFLVIKGRALFRFRHMQTGQLHELLTNGETPQIVETVPGWAHDVKNVGSEEMVVMLWANEKFDRDRTDTYNSSI